MFFPPCLLVNDFILFYFCVCVYVFYVCPFSGTKLGDLMPNSYLDSFLNWKFVFSFYFWGWFVFKIKSTC